MSELKPEAMDEQPSEENVAEAFIEARNGVYTAQEVAISDIMSKIFTALNTAYERGVSSKELRKKSGLKKKEFRKIEEMDMNARLGDVIKVLNAAGMTLVVRPLEEAEHRNGEQAQDPEEER